MHSSHKKLTVCLKSNNARWDVSVIVSQESLGSNAVEGSKTALEIVCEMINGTLKRDIETETAEPWTPPQGCSLSILATVHIEYLGAEPVSDITRLWPQIWSKSEKEPSVIRW